MHFAHINMLAWVWVGVGLLLFLKWAKGHRQTVVKNFSEEHLLKDIACSFDPKKYKQKNILLIIIVLLSVLALIRPQWGFQWQEIQRQGMDI